MVMQRRPLSQALARGAFPYVVFIAWLALVQVVPTSSRELTDPEKLQGKTENYLNQSS